MMTANNATYDVTVVMTTYANDDFTRATTRALRRFYPDLPIIYADGSPDWPFDPKGSLIPNETSEPPIKNARIVWIPNSCSEDARNAAAAIVSTKYILFMDNDAKVIGPRALDLVLEPFEAELTCACTGAYALRVTSIDPPKGYVGRNFAGHCYVTGFSAYFALHLTEAYHKVGGMPKEPFYPVPEELWKGVALRAYWGDYSIGRKYQEHGYECVTPASAVPVLHWSEAMPVSRSEADDWWMKNTEHTTLDPFDAGLIRG